MVLRLFPDSSGLGEPGVCERLAQFPIPPHAKELLVPPPPHRLLPCLRAGLLEILLLCTATPCLCSSACQTLRLLWSPAATQCHGATCLTQRGVFLPTAAFPTLPPSWPRQSITQTFQRQPRRQRETNSSCQSPEQCNELFESTQPRARARCLRTIH